MVRQQPEEPVVAGVVIASQGDALGASVVVLRGRCSLLLVIVADVDNGRAAKCGLHPLAVAVIDEAGTRPAAHPSEPVLGVIGQGVGNVKAKLGLLKCCLSPDELVLAIADERLARSGSRVPTGVVGLPLIQILQMLFETAPFPTLQQHVVNSQSICPYPFHP